MNIFEYQAKEILRQHGVQVPKGKVASKPSEAEHSAKEIGGSGWVIKAQILAGGRGKAGGIKIAKTLSEVSQYAEDILNTPLKTHQTGSSAKKVNQVLIEELCDIANELYLAITIDRHCSRAVFIASSQGGVEIEETAKKDPSAIFKEHIDPAVGLMPHQVRSLSFKLGIKDKELLKKAGKFITGFYNVFIKCDCLLAEINPLVITKQGEIVALDAKFSFDDSALSRHPEIAGMRSLEEELPVATFREDELASLGERE